MALTLNWFDVATAFPLIGAEFHVGLGSLSLLISLYIVGYGLSHIPGGMLSTRIGMKRTIVLGLGLQGVAGVMSGLSVSYPELAFFRVISGIGGSVFVAVGMAAMAIWFREHEVTLALGITGGAAFSAGAAVALYVWIFVQRDLGWHTSLGLAGIFELGVMAVTLITFAMPQGCRHSLETHSSEQRFGHPWPVGIYGSTGSHCSVATAPTSPPLSSLPPTQPRFGT